MNNLIKMNWKYIVHHKELDNKEEEQFQMIEIFHQIDFEYFRY